MSKSVDISKLTVEDIFRAKEERRRRLAKLPFDQKIVIVNKLRATVKEMKGERAIFAAFLRACPNFASEQLKDWDLVGEWYAKHQLNPPPHPFDKRPDIIGVTAAGKKIGIELKSWLNRDQIAKVRKQEIIQENIRKAIGNQESNETDHVGQVWLSPRDVRFHSDDASNFREQLLTLIKREDRQDLDGITWRDVDVGDFPILRKYLKSARLFSRKRFRSRNWITFPYATHHFSPNTMRATLNNALIVHTKDERYNQDLRMQASLDEIYLLVHYDFKSFAYNTPFDAPNFGFKEAADFARKTLNGDGGYFDRIFLFHFLWSEEEAHRIF
jgi:hypothetical protein